MTLILEWGAIVALICIVLIMFLRSLSDAHNILKWLLGGLVLAILMLGTGAEINIIRDYNSTVCEIDANNQTYCNTAFSEDKVEETADRMVLLYRIFSWLFYLYLVYLVFFVLIFPLPGDAMHGPKQPMQQSPESRRMRRW